MVNRNRLSWLLLSLATLSLAGISGGCVVYPTYPAYPAYPAYGYGYGSPYYGGAYVGFGPGWHDGGWRR
jgi:hypothetical protein